MDFYGIACKNLGIVDDREMFDDENEIIDEWWSDDDDIMTNSEFIENDLFESGDFTDKEAKTLWNKLNRYQKDFLSKEFEGYDEVDKMYNKYDW